MDDVLMWFYRLYTRPFIDYWEEPVVYTLLILCMLWVTSFLVYKAIRAGLWLANRIVSDVEEALK